MTTISTFHCHYGLLRKLAISLSLLMATVAPAAAMQGKECAQRAERIPEDKREDFIVRCLQRAQSPANIKAESHSKKQKRCSQNAKNLHLKGEKKSKYLSACLEKNEAAIASKRKPDNNIPLSEIPFLEDIKSSALLEPKSGKKKSATHRTRAPSVSAEPTMSELVADHK